MLVQAINGGVYSSSAPSLTLIKDAAAYHAGVGLCPFVRNLCVC
ncbi:MAG: hypothetical protein P4L40_18315 [Terracidiphilus sp.]|nr:hypothetical protein [Terracidiphilus sp.]